MTETFTHRELAAQSYNAAWTLLESERTPAQDLELLTLAFTSRHHWTIAGGQQELAVSDWMVSRCCAAVGEARLAVRFAEAALAGLPQGSPAWLVASLHEGMARACAAAGDATGRDRHLASARVALAEETDDEDRALIQSQLDDVPT
jgi:hypothetical protein